MKKNIFNKIICSLLFVSIIFSSVVALTFFVRPKTNTKAAGYKHASAMQVTAEDKNTLDVLVLGDSLAYRSICPLRVWQKSGITSYVCGTPSQRLCYSEEFLRLTFENQSPKIVFVETNAIFRDTDVSQILTNELEKSLDFFRFHNRWKTLTRADITSALSVNYSCKSDMKGYRFSRKAKITDTTGYMAYTTDVEAIAHLNEMLIKRISRLCKKNGARLVLYSAPSVENYDYARHNALTDLAETLGCEYIDMNLMRSEVPVNWKYSSTDGGDHLNYAGAIKVSDYVAKYLSELKLFEDKRLDPNYSEWNAALQKFNEEHKIKSDEKEAHRAKKKAAKKLREQLEKEQKKLQNATGNPSATLPATTPNEDETTSAVQTSASLAVSQESTGTQKTTAAPADTAKETDATAVKKKNSKKSSRKKNGSAKKQRTAKKTKKTKKTK